MSLILVQTFVTLFLFEHRVRLLQSFRKSDVPSFRNELDQDSSDYRRDGEEDEGQRFPDRFQVLNVRGQHSRDSRRRRADPYTRGSGSSRESDAASSRIRISTRWTSSTFPIRFLRFLRRSRLTPVTSSNLWSSRPRSVRSVWCDPAIRGRSKVGSSSSFRRRESSRGFEGFPACNRPENNKLFFFMWKFIFEHMFTYLKGLMDVFIMDVRVFST